jgi:hypothetical protein
MAAGSLVVTLATAGHATKPGESKVETKSGETGSREGRSGGPETRNLVPGRDGFTLVADRLASIRYTIHLVARTAEDQARARVMLGMLPAAAAQINEHIGRDRLTISARIVADPASLSGTPGNILIEPESRGRNHPGHTDPTVMGSAGWIFDQVCGANIQIDRGLIDARIAGEVLPFILLHELLHAMGLFHFDGEYQGAEQVMRTGTALPFTVEEPGFKELIAGFLAKQNTTPDRCIAEWGESRYRDFCEKTLHSIVKLKHRPVLCAGDINGLRYVTRHDAIDRDTGVFTPQDTVEDLQERRDAEASGKPCGGWCAIL